MWPDLITKSKEGGANVIQTYAFWNGHEPIRGQVSLFIVLKKEKIVPQVVAMHVIQSIKRCFCAKKKSFL